MWLKIALNAVNLPKFEAFNGGKRFTATFQAAMILCMRQRAVWSWTQGHTLFWRITPFVLIIAP